MPKAKDVTLYVVPDCPMCATARAILRLNNVVFNERDVKSDYAALRRMYRLTRQGLVPVVEVNGEAVVRPSVEQLKAFVLG